jgi:5-methyltetrahydrofolate--homocysteine methyltransferase
MADGATGTNLFQAGLPTGEAPELWNISEPDRILAHYRASIGAGADLILTNTFGGTRHRLKLHQAQDRVHEINFAAARLAREATAASGRDVIVAGSIGPTGELFAPLGNLTPETARAAFREQAEALRDGGVDLLWIETMSALEEVAAAAEAAADLRMPYAATCSFDTNGRTMMGITPARFVEFIHSLPVPPLAYGANCGVGAADLVYTILQLAETRRPGDILIAKGNCGIPYYEEGKITYSGTPELMADYARLARDAGAMIIGGCCGTTYRHLCAIRDAIDHGTPGIQPALADITAKLGDVAPGTRQALEANPLEANPRRRQRRQPA